MTKSRVLDAMQRATAQHRFNLPHQA